MIGKNKNGNNNNNNSVTAVTLLNRKQIDCLDKLGKDCFFKYGRKLSRSKILSELVNLLMNMKVNIKKVDLENENLWEGILRVLKNENHENA